MTDAHLMDAECIHGYVWYECPVCEDLNAAALAAERDEAEARNDDDRS